MRKNDNQTDLGAIKIHKNVIASIASLAAMEIEGSCRVLLPYSELGRGPHFRRPSGLLPPEQQTYAAREVPTGLTPRGLGFLH